VKIIDYNETTKLLPMAECIALMREAFVKLAEKTSVQYLRTYVRLPDGNILGLMPGYYDGEYFGCKVITIFNSNIGTNFPSHQGSVLLYGSKYGEPLAMVDGDAITRIRTGAVSAVATDILARKDAKTAAFIGAGAQARSHLEAILCVRPLTSAAVYDLNAGSAAAFAEEMTAKHGIPVKSVASPAEAAKDADIICTVSPSKTPVLYLKDVKPGVHINAVGASIKTDREIGSDLAAAGRFFGDYLESVMAEAGDFLIPKGEGLFGDSHFLGELGDLLTKPDLAGRKTPEDITIFEALGLAVEDVAAAKYVYEKSLKQ